MADEVNEFDMIDLYQLDINSNELCRNCLARNCELKSLFRCDIIDGEIWPIPKVYQSVTNISIAENDNFPSNVCTKCETTLFDAFMFQQKSVKSHNLLRKILKNASHDENTDTLEPLIVCRQSQSTQTSNDNENMVKSLTIDELDCILESQYDDNESENGKDDEVKEEDDEIWQLVYENEEEEEEEEEEEGDEEEDSTAEEILQPMHMVFMDEISAESTETVAKTTLNEPYTDCEYCGEAISQRKMSGHLKQHTKILPHLLNSVEFFRCSRCFTTFPFINDLLEHLNNDEICTPIVDLNKDDDICTDYQFLINDPPVRLFSTSKNFDTNTYSCSLCILDFENLMLFRAHFEDTHLSNAKCNPDYLRADLEHSCGICGNVFKGIQDTLHHIYFHRIDYRCLYGNCETIFNSFTSFYMHFTQQHSSVLAECSHCNYLAKDKHDLKEHQRNLCIARNLICDHCGKTFYKKNTLNMHIRTHTNNRKYRCTMCPKAFLQSNDLSNHIRTHTHERPFKCTICDKRFKTVGQRIGHMATHTTENNFECDVCHKCFKSARILHGHKKLHGERQFNCELCEKKFSRKYHLTLHLKRHEKRMLKKKKKT